MKARNNILLSGLTFAISLFTILLVSKGNALAATKTWTGAGGDWKFSTASNWDGDSIPTNGDVLEFPSDKMPTDYEDKIDMDIEDLSIDGMNFIEQNCDSIYHYPRFQGSITLAGDIDSSGIANSECRLGDDISFYSGSGQAGEGVTLSGDSVSFIPGSHAKYISFHTKLDLGTTDFESHGLLYISTTDLLGSGTLKLHGNFGVHANSTFSGEIDTSEMQGILTVYNFSSANASTRITSSTNPIVIGDGVSLIISTTDGNSVADNYTISGNSHMLPAGYNIVTSKMEFSIQVQGLDCSTAKAKLTGTIIFNIDVKDIKVDCGELTIEDAVLNGHTVGIAEGVVGGLVINGTKKVSQLNEITVTDKNKCHEARYSVNNRTYIDVDCSGKLGSNAQYPSVVSGILAGNGKVGHIKISSGGIIAPGHSPGTLTVASIEWEEGGIYQFEIDKDAADQIISNGTVKLGNGTLDIKLLNDFIPTAGAEYTIIDNKSDSAVEGTFKDLPEGTTFKVGEITYKITYTGGDGNDVVLTVAGSPKAPNTGYQLLKSNPLLTLAITTLSALFILVVAKKQKVSSKR